MKIFVKISTEDLTILNNLVQSNLPLLDYSGALDLVQYYHRKYWIQVAPRRRCTFCPSSSSLFNEYLRAPSCETCLSLTKDINPRNPHSTQCLFIKDMLQEWIRKELHVVIKARDLTTVYNRCMICKKVLESDDDVAVTDVCIICPRCCCRFS